MQTSISGKKNINKQVFALTAKVYYELKEFEKAQDYALKSLAIDSSSCDSLIILGDIAKRNNEIQQAESYYKKAASKDDTNEADIKLAEVYQMQDNIKKAKDIYAKILKNSSKAYKAYYHMALLDKEREETYLKKTVAINPAFGAGWVDLARLEIDKDSYEQALSYLDIAKYIGDTDYRYYYYRGLVMKNKGLLTEASKNFEKSYNLNSNFDLVKKELEI